MTSSAPTDTAAWTVAPTSLIWVEGTAIAVSVKSTVGAFGADMRRTHATTTATNETAAAVSVIVGCMQRPRWPTPPPKCVVEETTPPTGPTTSIRWGIAEAG